MGDRMSRSTPKDLIVDFPSEPRKHKAPRNEKPCCLPAASKLTTGDRMNRSTSDGLIVDFLSQPMKHKAPRNKSKPRAVTFDSVCDVVIVPEDKMASKSYSRQDIRRFNQTMVRDILRMSREINSTPGKSIPHDRLCECIGLERFLSQAVLKRAGAEKRAHIDAVLEEQSSQVRDNICDEEKLSQKSRASSRWARGRAEQLAAGYFQLRK
mmetsp:Transcript_41999/g.75665  ORF Transcript_41999/g.75665 Transcript_41999/m.75665 type:complete len:210 (-) Transcript_41999:51-680(-)|eukprot:CAMPEP_0201875378 /NCGR_PEP_ID=MMETSP0902-20130614/7374_1 /ASSEMBLY_ACC=CAM_ASM_000551 /TAXON_ID=420261 /ORGANISM="Thalassiosira antarctica, Strain CCMP982" /LENGTH=209 /DNA_ID=CAMNT_0048402425 /DNA_START=198 /DNA_END=827 /DNA_ORIENTATION=+